MEPVIVLVTQLGGVASCGELMKLGTDRAGIDRSVRRGDLSRLRNGWVAVPQGAPSDVVAAVRAGGTLACVSALATRAIWTREDERRHVRVRRFAHDLAPDPGVVHHRSLQLDGLQPAVGGVDSVELALVHAIMCQPRRDAVASMDSALHHGLISEWRLASILAPLPACYSSLGALANGAAESGLETHLRLLLHSVGIEARVQVRISGVGRVDLLVGDRLVIETDGREWHSDRRSFADDKRRDFALAEQGYVVLRLSYAQVILQPHRTLDTIRAIVERGEHRWSGRHRRRGLVLS
ncbi:endonuclease domain-containing protein [Herbiconiux sp. UC225_62]|uniref:endonuclease domain-containing protein n=1 Tax=Herbiconiux sp. UC225_62 TaxID=3350168 RepID=UPI0036D2FACC